MSLITRLILVSKFTSTYFYRKDNTMLDPTKLSVYSARNLMVSGDLTSEKLTRCCLDRIEEREMDVHAWTTYDKDRALNLAKAADKSGLKGCLGGIPLGLKDIIDTVDFDTEYNSVIYKKHRPELDAACAIAVKEAGAVSIGKTVTTTFAHRNPGPTRNPHNHEHSPGGSSSGSAAAVADFMVPLAIGTQTGGSVLRPGAYCGVLAYKPAFDAINFGGTKQISASLDTLGFFVRSLDDIPIAGAALQGLNSPLKVTDEKKAPRVTLIRTPSWNQAERCGRDLVESIFEKLGQLGAKTREFVLPSLFNELFHSHTVICGIEAQVALAWEIKNTWNNIPQPTRNMIDEARQFSQEEYLNSLACGETCRRKLTDIIEKDEIILTLPAPGEAPEGIKYTGSNS